MKKNILILVACLISLSGFYISEQWGKTDAQILKPNVGLEANTNARFADLLSKAEDGNIRVIVGLQTKFEPEGNLFENRIYQQRTDIKKMQKQFLNNYQSYRFREIKKFRYIPYLAIEVDAEGLRRMRNDPLVFSIQEDMVGEPGLAESTRIVGADKAWIEGYSGKGQTIAILDSGVDKNHEFLSGRVVSEACFSSNIEGRSKSFCPGGASSSTASDSGLHCEASMNGCPHGTNVAGIAAGRGTSFSGVAKDANIIAVQMFSEFTCNGSPCARYWTSDLIRALEHIRTLAETNNIAAVNVSLQTGHKYLSNCDVDQSATKAAIDNLKSVNIPTIICAGNYSFTDSLTAPACISTSISVGSTDDGSLGTSFDTVSNFSDSSQLLHLLAPGRWINSSIPGNRYANYYGTSMAAPHVAGAFAVLKQKKPNADINQIFDVLVRTGKPILDTRNSVTKSRIQIDKALAALTATAKYDFDGDGKTDIGIFRPAKGEWWYLRSSDNTNRAFQFGSVSDKIVPADYTGDGKTDFAFFRPASGTWFILRSEDSSFYAFPFGGADDIPAPADFDGDGKADPAIFRPATATWYILKSTGGTNIQQFGVAEDVPQVADFDGDGKADLAVFRPTLSQWWISNSTGGVRGIQFGAPGDKPVAADYTGDGKTDIAIWRPANGSWFILRSEDNSFYSFPFGAISDQPAPGDYDGDGKTDAAVFRNDSTTWYLNQTSNGSTAVSFGANGDKPISSAYIP